MRSTANGSRPAWSMPRIAPEPRSKTSVSPLISTTTQLCLLFRRGTTVPEPTTVISILGRSFPPFEGPREPGDAEEDTPDDVRCPVHPEVDAARGYPDEENYDRRPQDPVRPEDEDGSEQDDQSERVPARVGVRVVHLHDRRRVGRACGLVRHWRLR